MLTRIPDDLIPFAVLGLGAAMLVVIVLIHGYGIDQKLRDTRK